MMTNATLRGLLLGLATEDPPCEASVLVLADYLEEVSDPRDVRAAWHSLTPQDVARITVDAVAQRAMGRIVQEMILDGIATVQATAEERGLGDLELLRERARRVLTLFVEAPYWTTLRSGMVGSERSQQRGKFFLEAEAREAIAGRPWWEMKGLGGIRSRRYLRGPLWRSEQVQCVLNGINEAILRKGVAT